MATPQVELLPPADTGGASSTAGANQRAYSPLTLWAAAAFAVILGFSRLSYGLVLPSLRANLHGSYGVFGLVGSANLADYLLGMLLFPAILSHTHNRRRLNSVALLALSLAMMASALSVGLIDLAVWRLLIGVCSAVATVLTITLTLELIAPEERGRASGVLWMGGAAGLVVSGALAPLVVGGGQPAAWRFLWVGMGLAGLVTAWGVRRSLRPATAHFPRRAAEPGERSWTESGASKTERWFADLHELLLPHGLLTLT
ncbi:MAG: MFS transporter, partial [Chloroflexota bacterium]